MAALSSFVILARILVGAARKVPYVFVAFFAVAAVSYLAACVREKRRPGPLHFLAITFPPDQVIHPTTKVDVVAYGTTKVCRWTVRLATQMVVAAAAAAFAGLSGLAVHAPLPSGLVLGGAVAAFFVLSDFTIYISHWLQHRSPLLWEFHKVHHTATFLTPLTSARFHPVGEIMDESSSSIALFIVVAAANLLAPLDPAILVASSSSLDTVLTIFLLTQLQHSAFPIRFGWLEAVFVSPAMHQLHHSALPEHYGKNLGSRLAIWDWLFQTGRRSRRGERIVYGLSPSDAGWRQTVVESYLSPFRSLRRRRPVNASASPTSLQGMDPIGEG